MAMPRRIGLAILLVASAIVASAREVRAYSYDSHIEYDWDNDEISGYSFTYLDWFDEDSGQDCYWWEGEGGDCQEWISWQNSAYVSAEAYGPDEGDYGSGDAQDNPNAQVDIDPFSPTDFGDWDIAGDHYMQYDYWYSWNGDDWWYGGNSYDYLGSSSDQTTNSCGDSNRDNLRKEYITYGVNLRPRCDDFTQARSSGGFSYSEIAVTDEYSWGLVRDPLIAPLSATYGIDAWQWYIGYGGYGSRHINSGFRNPHRNSTQGGAQNSRHMYGDAADFRNDSTTSDEYWTMYNAAFSASADFVEDPSGPCGMACAHADWRSHSGGYQ